MSNAAHITSIARSAAYLSVKRAERETGSLMGAYEVVARSVGTTSQWLRKFIKGQQAKEPTWTTGFRILDHYHRVCSRVEQAREQEQELKREIDAAIESISWMAAGLSAAKEVREAPAATAPRGNVGAGQ